MRFTTAIFSAALVACGLAAPVVDGDVFSAFLSYTKKYNKQYSEKESSERLQVFTKNLERINEMNAKHILVGGEAIFGITQFTDVTLDEFKKTHLNYVSQNSTKGTVMPKKPAGGNAPAIDWRTQGAVTPVKNQGQCGSCWAFSATEALESYGKISGKYSLQVLAPQQIVSCDTVDQGCNGGWPYQGWEYVESAGGMNLEVDYPYTSGNGQAYPCKADPTKFALKGLTGFQHVTASEDGLETALNAGPASVCVYAESWQHYTGGVMKDCGMGPIDHAVQAVGYTSDYWIVRNSWDTSWGELGYIRLERGSDICHIYQDVYYPEL